MALLKSVELNSGVVAEYWKIAHVTVDCSVSDPNVRIWLALYINQTTRNNGKQAIHTQEIEMKLSDIDAQFSYDFRACLYHTIKSLSDWNTSTDIIESDGS